MLALGRRRHNVIGFIYYPIAILLGRLRAPQALCSQFYIYFIVTLFSSPKSGGSASKCQPKKLGLQICKKPGNPGFGGKKARKKPGGNAHAGGGVAFFGRY